MILLENSDTPMSARIGHVYPFAETNFNSSKINKVRLPREYGYD